MVDDVGVGAEHAARQPVVAQELPDVLDRVQLGRSGWQEHQREIVWHDEIFRAVPSGPVHQHDPMGSGRYGLRDLGQVQVSAKCRFMAGVSHRGSTRAAPLPCCGQIAPKM